MPVIVAVALLRQQNLGTSMLTSLVTVNTRAAYADTDRFLSSTFGQDTNYSIIG